MSEHRNENADLPRPRKPRQPAKSGQDTTAHTIRPARPQNAAGLPQPQNVKRRNPQTDQRRSYGSDTAEVRLPIYGEDPYEDMNKRQVPRNLSGTAYRQRATAPPPPRRRRKRRRSNPLGRLLRWLLRIAFILFGLYSLIALLLISRLDKVPRESRAYTDGSLQASHVRNILLIGTDARDVTEERGRSDSMMLLSINSKAKTIYLTSFMRDCYVEIPGYGSEKLNAAYSYGGPELLMDTIEYNFDVHVEAYLAVSFTGFAHIIDAFGGVKIDLSDEEAQAVNEILISEVNELMGDEREADLLSEGGTLLLDGKQALSYARIRYVGNADFERTSRQREVMQQLFANAGKKAVTAVPSLVSQALPQLSTNMSTTEMYVLSLRMPFCLGYDMVQQRIPAEETWWDDTIDGQSVLQVDFDANKQVLQDTVFRSTK